MVRALEPIKALEPWPMAQLFVAVLTIGGLAVVGVAKWLDGRRKADTAEVRTDLQAALARITALESRLNVSVRLNVQATVELPRVPETERGLATLQRSTDNLLGQVA